MPVEPLRVGMVASLSGQFRAQGRQALEGAAAWARDVNAEGGIYVRALGRKLRVQLRFYNDESVARLARAMSEKLILEDQVNLLLGPYSSVLTLAVAPIAERHHRVLWNHGGASDQIYRQGYRWVVSVLAPASRYHVGVIDLIRERDPAARRVAVLRSSKGSFPEEVVSGVERYAVRQGLEVVFRGSYDPGSTDFSPLLEELQGHAPDLILGAGRIQDELLLARQIVERKVSAKAVALVVAGIAEFGEALGPSAEGFMGPSQWEAAAQHPVDYGPSAGDLAARSELFRPAGADYAAAQAYAAGLVAQRCVEEAGTMENSALREVAERLDFTTFYGRFKLDPETGEQVGCSVVIVQWQHGRKVVVWPRSLRQGELHYPMGQGR